MADIKEAAWAQIAAEGVSALSLRGLARQIGMSPAGLYRYVDGLDELVTSLLVDAYTELADAVEQAAGPDVPPREALIGAARAYRAWAVAHPNRFLLIFGTPIPGYAAPEAGPTVEANTRMGLALMTIGARAWQAGDLAPPSRQVEPSPREVEMAALLDPDMPAALVGDLVSGWAHFHGLVILEVTNQLRWLGRDPDAYFAQQVGRIADALGMTAGP